MSDVAVRVHALHVHPVKSCGVVTLDEVQIAGTGFAFDRAWMVVDADGVFVSQRELPRMALVRQVLRDDDLVLHAPGMPALTIGHGAAGATCRVTVWDDEVAAFDQGAAAAQWFTALLGRPLRLVRFDPAQRRLSNPRWTGTIEAENAFADGYPVLVTSTASLAELNRRLALQGEAAVTMARLRPNLVLDGLDEHGEDHLDEIVLPTGTGPVVLKLVKPCARCSIPDVDPATAVQGHSVSDALAGYRADARLDGALTFGMNAVIVEGVGRVLRTGMAGSASFLF